MASDYDASASVLLASVAHRGAPTVNVRTTSYFLNEKGAAEAPAPAPAPTMREPGGFAYQAVVRKKCERAKMPGHFCDQCQGFIDATKDQLSDADVKKLQDECSRHKAYHPPPGTPEGFWELSFMDSQEKRKQDSLDAF